MLYNKNNYRKTNDKKVLHKVKKQWIVVSVATLAALGATGYANKLTHAANVDRNNLQAQNQGNQSAANHSLTMASPQHSNGNQAQSASASYVVHNPSLNQSLSARNASVANQKYGQARATFNQSSRLNATLHAIGLAARTPQVGAHMTYSTVKNSLANVQAQANAIANNYKSINAKYAAASSAVNDIHAQASRYYVAESYSNVTKYVSASSISGSSTIAVNSSYSSLSAINSDGNWKDPAFYYNGGPQAHSDYESAVRKNFSAAERIYHKELSDLRRCDSDRFSGGVYSVRQ